jgi:hypothetical protein
VKARRAEYNSRCSTAGPCTASRWVEGAEGAGVVVKVAARDSPELRLQVEERPQELPLQALSLLLPVLPLRVERRLLAPADHPPVARIREKTVPAAPSEGGAAKEPGLRSNPPVQRMLPRRQPGPILRAGPALGKLLLAKPALPQAATARLAGDSGGGGAEAVEPAAQTLPNSAEVLAAAGAAAAQRRAATPLPHLRIRLRGRAISRARGALP